MHIKKSLNDNSGNEIIDAKSYINEIVISKGAIAFLLQSYAPPESESDNEPCIPFRAAYYHCDFDETQDLYTQCFNYMLTLDDFSGGELVTAD